MSDSTERPRPNGPGVTLAVPPIAGLYQVLASPPAVEVVERRLRELETDVAIPARPAGPDKWFLLAPDAEAAMRLSQSLATGLDERASVLDQSDGRVLIVAQGPDASDMLAKGTGMDLDPSAFKEGASAGTAFGHVTIHITRTGAGRYEFLVMRSFAESLWESLREAAREFGCTAPADLIEQA